MNIIIVVILSIFVIWTVLAAMAVWLFLRAVKSLEHFFGKSVPKYGSSNHSSVSEPIKKFGSSEPNMTKINEMLDTKKAKGSTISDEGVVVVGDNLVEEEEFEGDDSSVINNLKRFKKS